MNILELSGLSLDNHGQPSLEVTSKLGDFVIAIILVSDLIVIL